MPTFLAPTWHGRFEHPVLSLHGVSFSSVRRIVGAFVHSRLRKFKRTPFEPLVRRTTETCLWGVYLQFERLWCKMAYSIPRRRNKQRQLSSSSADAGPCVRWECICKSCCCCCFTVQRPDAKLTGPWGTRDWKLSASGVWNSFQVDLWWAH